MWKSNIACSLLTFVLVQSLLLIVSAVKAQQVYRADVMRNIQQVDLSRWDDTRVLSGFDAISVEGSIQVHLTQGDLFEVIVIGGKLQGAPGEPLSNIRRPAGVVTEIHGTTLIIRHERVIGESGVLEWGRGGRIDITLPTIKSINASGRAEVQTETTFVGTELEVRTLDRSEVALELDMNRVEVFSSGNSEQGLRGKAHSLYVVTAGGSFLDASDLRVEEAEVHSSEGSEAEIAASARLFARATGGSEIAYYGSIPVVDSEFDAGAEITRH